MGLDLITMALLIIDKVINFISFWHAGDEVRLFNLHVVQNFVDIHVGWLEIGSGLDE
jgi:hypothetical protein